MKLKGIALALLALLLLAGCGKKEEDKEYTQCIGVIVTNNADLVFDEVYLYDAVHGVNAKGSNLVPKADKTRWVGSFGGTVKVADAYNLMVRDVQGHAYVFEEVDLRNADEVVVEYDEKEGLMAELRHRDGGSETLTPTPVNPGDAPSRSFITASDASSSLVASGSGSVSGSAPVASAGAAASGQSAASSPE